MAATTSSYAPLPLDDSHEDGDNETVDDELNKSGFWCLLVQHASKYLFIHCAGKNLK